MDHRAHVTPGTPMLVVDSQDPRHSSRPNQRRLLNMPRALAGQLMLLTVVALFSLAVRAEPVPVDYDFCHWSAVDASTDSDPGRQIWSAVTLQREITAVTRNPLLRDTPWDAYPLVYINLTHARDVERCGGRLSTADRQNRLIGDLLADYMSRWLALSVVACARHPEAGDRDFGFCAAMSRIRNQRQNALQATLEMTAVYLSSHMAMGIAAVARDDAFWNQEFPSPTHCQAESQPCAAAVLDERLKWMRRYKQYYDLNNDFLARNFATVIDTLERACYIDGALLGLGTRLTAPLPGLDLLFGTIRDRTFLAGLAWAARLDPVSHPMLVWDPDLAVWSANIDDFRTMNPMPAELAGAEKYARATLAVANFATRFLPSAISLGWTELSAKRPSDIARCRIDGHFPAR